VTNPNKTHGRVLVFGASGYIGTHLVGRLLELSYPLRASARNREVLEDRDWQGVERVQADVLKPETLVAALRDVDVAYYLVHSMAAGRDFARLDREAASNFARAAARACGGNMTRMSSPSVRSRLTICQTVAGGEHVKRPGYHRSGFTI